MTTIDYEYYDWLVSQIAAPPGKSFKTLFDILHSTEFYWTIPHDDNRMQDAVDLRYEFLSDRDKKLDLKEATLLEVLVALSRRTAFAVGQSPKTWAWKLIKNLRLHRKSDPLTDEDIVKINDILDALVWRTYHPSGQGGFFPLNHPEQDQTKLEIWDQMNQYVIEKQIL